MKRLAEHVIDRLIDQASRDDRVWLLDGDLGDSYGAPRFAAFYPDRFVMAGIAEQNMVGVAAGLASCGARPFVFSFAAFLAYRSADQIRVALAQSGLPVTLVGSHAGGCVGRNGRSHAAIGDIAAMGSLGLEIWAPADQHDVDSMLAVARSSEAPRYCRTPRTPVTELPFKGGPVRTGLGGGGSLLLGYGLSSHWALELQAELARRGLSSDVASVACLQPLPSELGPYIAQADRLVVIEDHVRQGGLADLVAARFGRLPDRWFGWQEHCAGFSDDRARQRAGLDSAAMAAHIVGQFHA